MKTIIHYFNKNVKAFIIKGFINVSKKLHNIDKIKQKHSIFKYFLNDIFKVCSSFFMIFLTSSYPNLIPKKVRIKDEIIQSISPRKKIEKASNNTFKFKRINNRCYNKSYRKTFNKI